jgi:hypothetical protein
MINDFIVFAKHAVGGPSEEQKGAYNALERIQTTYSYCAPELQSNLWTTLYQDFICPHVIPWDGEPWTLPIKRRWSQDMKRLHPAQ